MMVMHMGILVTLKTPVYKQGNKISSRLETLGPLQLNTLTVIPAIKMDYLELPRDGKTKKI